jgi:tRNA(Ile)-lysidine synthase
LSADFPHKMAKTLEKYQMVKKGGRVLAAFSGGPDSLALLCAFLAIQEEWQLHLACAHLDHGLRGQASREDADWAEEFCRRRGVPFFRGYWPGHEETKAGRSPESAARQARRLFLETTLRDWGGDVIALGHHQDDQAETVLIHLVNGAGLRGLGGIWPLRAPYIRPLLELSRQQIMHYLNEQGLTPRQDSSNENQAYLRNRLRRQVIPLLRECNPQFDAAVSRLAGLARQEDCFLDGLAAQALPELLRPVALAGPLAFFAGLSPAGLSPAGVERPGLDIGGLLGLDPVLGRRALRLWLPKETDQAGLQRIYDLAAAGQNGAWAEAGGGLRVKRERDCLFLEDKQEAPSPAFAQGETVPGSGLALAGGRAVLAVRWGEGDAFAGGQGAQGVQLEEYSCAWPQAAGWPILRRRRPGDWLSLPYGRKKLKALLNEKKVPLAIRDTLPLVAWGAQVLWVPGLAKALGPFEQENQAKGQFSESKENRLQYVIFAAHDSPE